MAREYADALKFALPVQLILGFLASLMLDGGECLQYWEVAMAAFWGGAITGMLRFRKEIPRFSPLYLKWGFFLVLFVTPLLMNLIWHWRGVR